MNATQVFVETPHVAAANTPISGAGFKPVKPNGAVSDFKKQLESCDEEAILFAPTMPCSGNTEDNSMANGSTAEPGIAGILEGFGLLDYQTDTPPNPAENLPLMALPETEVAADQPEQQARAAAETNQASVPEQFARMLSDKPLDALPPEVQQQIKSEVKEYQGSLESTNNDRSATRTGAKVTQEQVPALLLNLKTVQDAPPKEAQLWVQPDAEGAADKQHPAEQASARSAGSLFSAEPEAESAKPGQETQTSVQFSAAGAQSTATVKTNETAEAQTNQTDFVKDNVIRIVDKVSTGVREGQHEFEVTLKPEFLGKVSIRLMMENGSIRMQIRTEDMGVKGLFTDQMSGLQSMLREKGFAVSGIDVTCQSEMTGGYDTYGQNSSHSGSGQSGSHNNNRFAADITAGVDFYDAVAEFSEPYLSGSTVEYLA